MLLRLLLLLIGSSTVSVVYGVGDLGIPGTTSTTSGYDTELGQDPICWRGRAALNDDQEEGSSTTAFPNKLVEDFVLLGNTQLRLACPNGTFVQGFAPSEFGTPPDYKDGIRPRTGEWYNYRVTGSIDLTNLDGNALVSDTGTERNAMISVQVLLCELGQSGFCSPFIHEQANARLDAQNITTKIERGDRHGGTHVHSPYVFVNLSSTLGFQEFDVEVPMLINDPGDFFGIVAVNLFTADTPGGAAMYRHDVGNALNEKLVSYQSEAEILTVSNGAKIVSWTCCGIACCVILWLLISTVKHRSNRVITLSQGRFLIVFLIAALFASANVFLLDPKNDVYCNLAAPMILIPLQLLYAVTIARLWRINIVISPLLSRRMEPRKGCTHRFVHCVGSMTSRPCSSKEQRSTRNLRKSVNDTRLALVVTLFTLPQIIIQIFSLALQPNEVVVDFNQDESTGRTWCQAFSPSGEELKTGQSLETYSVLLLGVTLVMLMVVATQSRNLPSLFNETRSMYDSTLMSILILLLGIMVLVVTDGPTTSPDVEYLVWVTVILCITLNTTLRIMIPKLKLVWRGEKVVVSQLVSDYKAKQKRQQRRSGFSISGFSPRDDIEESDFISKATPSVEMPRTTVMSDTLDDGIVENGASLLNGAHNGNGGERFEEEPGPEGAASLDRRAAMDSEKKMPSEGLLSSLPSPSSGRKTPRSNKTMARSERTPKASPPRSNETMARSERKPKASRRYLESSVVTSMAERGTIVITDDVTPTRRLVLPMFELQHLLDQVNRRITSGKVVPHEEWISLKDACEQMGTTFQQDVEFGWEEEA